MSKNFFKSNEFIILIILIVLSLVVGLINPAFFSLSTVFDTLRASIVLFLLAFGFLPIIISGGIDISFVAIAAVTSYATHMLLLHFGYEGGTLVYFLVAGGMGVLAGLLNGILVTRFKLPIFENSLAIYTMWYGFTLFFIGATMNFEMPEGVVGYYSKFIVSIEDPQVGISGLHISIIFVIIIGILLWGFLRYTTIGRGIYAIGGNREVAIRSGFNISKIMLIIFVLMGVLSSIAGVTQGLLSRYFNPVLFLGQELDVLAAVIIGGASVTGGRGTVLGTVLGVLLIQVIDRALILTGIPPEWHRFTVGVVLILFISIPAIQERRSKRLGRTVSAIEE